jgi:hypothetical protein
VNGSIPDRYVRLCLRVGQHLEDFVDSYIGPDALKQEIASEDQVDPQKLHDEAAVLLDALPDEDLEADRAEWLLGQLRALECVTARLAGEEISWSDEVERCFGIRPAHVDESLLRESQKKLDEVLPGNGDLSARYNGWLEATSVPQESLSRAIETIAPELRRRTGHFVELPSGEGVEWETVTDVPWQAFNWYRGDLQSLVQLSIDLPRSIVDLIDLIAHEAYPGHHTERACKEEILYRHGARPETSVMVISAPEAVIAEGIATNALEMSFRDDGFAAMASKMNDLGFEFDPEVAEVTHIESWNLWAAGTNAARMLHEDGISRQEAESYLQEWSLMTPERAAKAVTFLTDPGSRAYATAYTDGKRICRSFIDEHPDGFKRLLTEQLTVSSLSST